MTQPSRTTESINRDNAGIRDIMHRIRDLTVPDRATLAVGLVGHLATMMNRSQMTKLLDELQEEAERVQDVPPTRRQDLEERTRATGSGRDDRDGGRNQPRQPRDAMMGGPGRDAATRDVGQGGRGEFRSGELV